MANSIDLATIFKPLLDRVYKRDSLTAVMDSMTEPINDAGEATIKIMKLDMTGAGNYSRLNGYPVGDINASWEALTLTIERGREFSVDKMDNIESLMVVVGKMWSEFYRTKMAPEIDATRFARYAAAAGGYSPTPATLDVNTILPAFDAAMLAMDEEEVPAERKLFISATCGKFLDGALTRMYGNDSSANRILKRLDEVDIIRVPQRRFYSEVTLDPGASSSAGGYSKTAGTGRDLNFMLMTPDAVVQATKLSDLKYFTPKENQIKDAHKWQYRLYHDAFIMDNHELGVYVHKKNS